MSERVIRQMIDDLDGSEIVDGGGERIDFAHRGVAYQIDLSTANAARLDQALQPFIDVAVKIGTARVTPAAPGDATRSKELLRAMRDWARKNGLEVSSRGPISAEVIAAFHAAD